MIGGLNAAIVPISVRGPLAALRAASTEYQVGMAKERAASSQVRNSG
jgi:hypothetical protein